MRRALATATLLISILSVHDAGAKDLNGRLGVGGARTLGGVGGLDILYGAGPFRLNGTVFLGFASPEVGDGQTVVQLAAGLLYPVLSHEGAELAFGGRVDIGVGDGTQLAVEAPLRLTWYVSDHFSLHGEVGVVIDVIPEEGRSFGDGPGGQGFGLVIGATRLTGGGGFTVIF